MIVGSVSTEVYRRIEEYTRKGPGADAAAKEESIVAAAAKLATEQNTNAAGTLVTAATSSAPQPPLQQHPTASRPARQIPSRHQPASPKTPVPPRLIPGMHYGSAPTSSQNIGKKTDRRMVGGSRLSPRSTKTILSFVGPMNQRHRRSKSSASMSPSCIPSLIHRANGYGAVKLLRPSSWGGLWAAPFRFARSPSPASAIPRPGHGGHNQTANSRKPPARRQDDFRRSNFAEIETT
jgi:hypothetical protein